MNEDLSREILVEMRRLRRSNELGMFVALALLGLFIGFAAWRIIRADQVQHKETARPAESSATAEWRRIYDAVDRGEYASALAAARAMTNRQPTYYYGYSCLGHVLLTRGDVTNAEASYRRACELYPSEDNEKELAIVRKRLNRERASSK
jgi:cytochrome c-type biogenesis protein CcmH/NrfG